MPSGPIRMLSRPRTTPASGPDCSTAILRVGLDLLAEMLQRPAFRVPEIDSERQVVIEEINMNEDDPSDVAFEEFTQAVFAGHPLETPVLGTRQSIKEMTQVRSSRLLGPAVRGRLDGRGDGRFDQA